MLRNNKNIHVDQIFIELTNLCNFNCLFCPNDKMARKTGFMDFHLAKRLIGEIADNNISGKIAFFLMGEPLLYPHIFEILKYASEKNIKVTVNTNGALLSENDNIDRLLDIPLDVLLISLQTPTSESFKLRRCSNGLTYEKYIGGIKTLLEKKARKGGHTKLDILFMDTNFNLSKLLINGCDILKVKIDGKEAKKLVEDFLKLTGSIKKDSSDSRHNLNSLIRNIAIDFRRFMLGNYRIEACERIGFIIAALHNWGDAMAGSRVMPASFGSCNALTEQFSILSNGDYSLCCKDYNGDLVIGNAYKQSIKEILASEKAQRIKRDFKLCRLSFKRCKICRGGSNIAELILKQIFSSIVYNVPFILRPLKKLALG